MGGKVWQWDRRQDKWFDAAGLDLKAPAKDLWRGMPTVGIDVDKPTIAASTRALKSVG